MADDFDKLEEELLAIPQFKTEYDALEPEHEIICQIQRQKSYVMRKQLVKLLLSLSSTTFLYLTFRLC